MKASTRDSGLQTSASWLGALFAGCVLWSGSAVTVSAEEAGPLTPLGSLDPAAPYGITLHMPIQDAISRLQEAGFDLAEGGCRLVYKHFTGEHVEVTLDSGETPGLIVNDQIVGACGILESTVQSVAIDASFPVGSSNPFIEGKQLLGLWKGSLGNAVDDDCNPRQVNRFQHSLACQWSKPEALPEAEKVRLEYHWWPTAGNWQLNAWLAG